MQWPFLTRMTAAIVDFYRGDTAGALETMGVVLREQPAKTWADCLPQTNLCAMHAWSGSEGTARGLAATVMKHVARAEKANLMGQWSAALVAADTLALLGDKPACASLYPAARAFAELGHRFDTTSFGPTTPILSAANAAAAGGHADLAREHFEQALDLAESAPSRIHQSIVRFWFGRHLSSSSDADARARGTAMLVEAVDRFRSMGMITHQQHAERALRAER